MHISKYSKNWQVALSYYFRTKKIQSQANYVSYNMIIIMFRLFLINLKCLCMILKPKQSGFLLKKLCLNMDTSKMYPICILFKNTYIFLKAFCFVCRSKWQLQRLGVGRRFQPLSQPQL